MQNESNETSLRNDDKMEDFDKPKPSHSSNKKFLVLILVTIILASFFGAIFGFVSAGLTNVFSSKISNRMERYFPSMKKQKPDLQASKQQVLIEDSAVIDVVKNSMSSVVSIVISKDIPKATNPFDQFFGGSLTPDPSQGSGKQQIGGGSGFFISADGIIMTNKHVVEDQNATYTVITNDGKEYGAKVISLDPQRDVALVKIEGSNFPVLNLGDSNNLEIGQTAIAIGNSLGEFTNSVSRGIISGLKRNVNAGSSFGDTERLTDIIQTDAAINPGISGGPLLDIQGNVIGINVARAQGAENIGFALPINQTKRLIDQVKRGDKISVPFFGVRYMIIDKNVQSQAQLPLDYGALVVRGTKMTDLAVVPGSPADKAGIVENDIIVEIDNQKITKDNQLSDIISKHNVGDVLKMKIWHKGQEKEIEVTLESAR